MSPEAWIALGSGVVVVFTIVYQAGKLSAKLDTVQSSFAAHEAEDTKLFGNVFESINEHREDIATLNAVNGLPKSQRSRRRQDLDIRDGK